MPNRIIRPGINRSRRVNSLDWAAEVFYRRLFAVADDYGVFELDFDLIVSDLYPLKRDRVSAADVAKWWDACSNAGLVSQYEVQGGVYGVVLNFQQQTSGKRKHPDPPEKSGLCIVRSSEDKKFSSVSYGMKKYSKIFKNIEEYSKIPSYGDGDGDEDGDGESRKRDTPPPKKAPDPPVPQSLLLAEKLWALYPKKTAINEAILAAKRAVEQEQDKGVPFETIEENFIRAVKCYAEEVNGWHPYEKKFIWTMKTFFEAGHPFDDPKTWKRNDQKGEEFKNGKHLPPASSFTRCDEV